MEDNEIEARCAEHTAPRVTPADVDSTIAATQFHRLTETLTVCVLTLTNGFTVTGESACASPENYDQEIGEGIAYKNARDKIWPLLGYALRNRLATNSYEVTDVQIAELVHNLRSAKHYEGGPNCLWSNADETTRALGLAEVRDCIAGGDIGAELTAFLVVKTLIS